MSHNIHFFHTNLKSQIVTSSYQLIIGRHHKDMLKNDFSFC